MSCTGLWGRMGMPSTRRGTGAVAAARSTTGTTPRPPARDVRAVPEAIAAAGSCATAIPGDGMHAFVPCGIPLDDAVPKRSGHRGTRRGSESGSTDDSAAAVRTETLPASARSLCSAPPRRTQTAPVMRPGTYVPISLSRDRLFQHPRPRAGPPVRPRMTHVGTATLRQAYLGCSRSQQDTLLARCQQQ